MRFNVYREGKIVAVIEGKDLTYRKAFIKARKLFPQWHWSWFRLEREA
jgi:hypothetical protein